MEHLPLNRSQKSLQHILFILFKSCVVALFIPFAAMAVIDDQADSQKQSIIESKIQKFQNLYAKNDPNLSLVEVESTQSTTRIMLRVTNETASAGSYCLSDIDDGNAFHVIDVDTNMVYSLEKQISKIKSCNKGEWYEIIEGEKVDIQLFFPRLPDSVKSIRLVEGSPNDSTISAEFEAITLDLANNN
ncbi:hypothetical protein [Thorsellia anophelis]|uniref:Uncharacterized protein n=1 Tax=Thorsellia anophelis DSM 18579 TaxID=1123402 RepID=A0A1I0E4H5_9GAMM|nr:hypothetical protein [Thorsellia anophelis]SET39247.1 hypothetical protein SAMN02583745_02228 [Thorsellia anophelis DSM 18579]